MTLLAIVAGAAFGSWSLVMSLTGLRAGGVAFMLLGGTFAVTAPWFLLIRPSPFFAQGRDPWIALLAGLGAAALNGIGMICLPTLLEARPHIVGTRILILNLTVVGVVSAWTIAFGEQALTPSKIAGIALAVVAVWLLGR
jgi:hypothetical protein